MALIAKYNLLSTAFSSWLPAIPSLCNTQYSEAKTAKY